VRADLEKNFLATVEELWPELGARVRSAARDGRFIGTADMQNFFRRSHGPGWALAGDAGYHKDPCTAQGITDAFKTAEMLADAVDDGLSGRRSLREALADYERRRDEAALPMFEWTLRVAAMRPVSDRTKMLLTALKASQPDTDRFIGVNAGTVLASEFFAAENVAKILSRSGTL
jgi:flavin-dependent dehydrogenase